MVGAMSPPRRRAEPPPPPDTEGAGREWPDRKEFFKSVSLFRDESDWINELAKEAKTSAAKFLSAHIRKWLWEEYRALLARKQRRTSGDVPPPPAAKGS